MVLSKKMQLELSPVVRWVNSGLFVIPPCLIDGWRCVRIFLSIVYPSDRSVSKFQSFCFEKNKLPFGGNFLDMVKNNLMDIFMGS